MNAIQLSLYVHAPCSAPVQYACEVKRVRGRTPQYPTLFDRRDDTAERAKSRRCWSHRIISLSLRVQSTLQRQILRTVKCVYFTCSDSINCFCKVSRLVTHPVNNTPILSTRARDSATCAFDHLVKMWWNVRVPGEPRCAQVWKSGTTQCKDQCVYIRLCYAAKLVVNATRFVVNMLDRCAVKKAAPRSWLAFIRALEHDHGLSPKQVGEGARLLCHFYRYGS